MVTRESILASTPTSLGGTPRLPIGRYRFLFGGERQSELSGYSGSAWRGALGHALKRLVCVTGEPRCEHCILYYACIYPYVFETPPPPDSAKMRRYDAVPHPYVLEPPDGLATESGQPYLLGLTLFGRANRYFPYVAHALQRAAERGIGGRRVPLDLTDLQQALPAGDGAWRPITDSNGCIEPRPPEPPALPSAPSAITIRFRTPLRLKRDEHTVGPEAFRFADLFGTLLRRISMLSYFHTETPLETDFRGLSAIAREVGLRRADLEWRDWTRYSSRQQTRMEMGGLVGSVELDLGGVEPL